MKDIQTSNVFEHQAKDTTIEAKGKELIEKAHNFLLLNLVET
jgi:hypothetical protein